MSSAVDNNAVANGDPPQQPQTLKNLQKVQVQVDPINGRKYFLKDGKRFEILTSSAAGSNVTVPATRPVTMNTVRNIVPAPPALTPLGSTNLIARNASGKITVLPLGSLPVTLQRLQTPSVRIIDNRLISAANVNVTFNPKPVEAPEKNVTEIAPVEEAKTVKIDSVKYHVVSMNVKNDKATGTEGLIEEPVPVEKNEIGVQTDPMEAPIINEDFLKFILDDLGKPPTHERNVEEVAIPRPKNKEDREKFNFFLDLRKALIWDKAGNLPIHESILQDNVRDLTRHCIVLKARRTSIDVPNANRRTPLHLAIDIEEANPAMVKTLLSFGADVYRLDPDGNNAFHLAVERGRPRVLQMLLERAHKAPGGCRLDDLNYAGMTALILATVAGSVEMVRMLLRHGADPNVNDGKSGRTALFHAALNCDVPIVQLLMEYKADPKKRNFFGTSAHDAMFEMDDIPSTIKSLILVREYRKHLTKKTEKRRDGRGGRRGKRRAPPSSTSPTVKRSRGRRIAEQTIDVTTMLECVTEEVDIDEQFTE